MQTRIETSLHMETPLESKAKVNLALRAQSRHRSEMRVAIDDQSGLIETPSQLGACGKLGPHTAFHYIPFIAEFSFRNAILPCPRSQSK